MVAERTGFIGDFQRGIAKSDDTPCKLVEAYPNMVRATETDLRESVDQTFYWFL